MSTLPSTFVTSLAAMNTSLAVMSTSVSGGGGIGYLKLTKQCIWEFGVDGQEVQPGSLWAVDHASFQHGFVCWEGDENKPNQKHGEEMRAVTEIPINLADLPAMPAGCKWTVQMGLKVLCLNGEDKGTALSFASNSLGARNAITALLREVVARAAAGEVDLLVPVISLGYDTYISKKWGKIVVPIFTVASWASVSGSPDDVDVTPPADTPPAAGVRKRRMKVV